ncbi:unnamed protein product, partial [Dovyalis caffra]
EELQATPDRDGLKESRTASRDLGGCVIRKNLGVYKTRLKEAETSTTTDNPTTAKIPLQNPVSTTGILSRLVSGHNCNP